MFTIEMESGSKRPLNPLVDFYWILILSLREVCWKPSCMAIRGVVSIPRNTPMGHTVEDFKLILQKSMSTYRLGKTKEKEQKSCCQCVKELTDSCHNKRQLQATKSLRLCSSATTIDLLNPQYFRFVILMLCNINFTACFRFLPDLIPTIFSLCIELLLAIVTLNVI